MDEHRSSEPNASIPQQPGATSEGLELLQSFYEGALECEKQSRVAAEEELRHEKQWIADLLELSPRLRAKTSVNALLDEVLNATVAIQRADFGNIQLYEPSTRSLRIVTQRGFDEKFLNHFRDSRDETSVCGRALLRKERVIVEDVLLDNAFQAHQDASTDAGFRAVQSTPLFAHDHQPLGMLSTHFAQPHRPSERELRLTDLYAHFAAHLIERQQTEDALRRKEALLTQAQKLSHTGSWALDIATGKLWWSDEHFRIVGLDPIPDGSTYPMALGLIHADDRAFVQGALETAIKERRRFEVECRIVRPDGQVRDILSIAEPVFDGSGTLIEYAGTMIDCTDRKAADEASRRLAALVENSSAFIGFANLKGQPVFVNPAGRKLVGLDNAEEVQATTTADYVIAEDKGLLYSAVEAAFQSGNWEGEVRFRNFKTGATIPVLQQIFVVTDPKSRERIGLATICRNITERKEAEQQLRDSERRFRQLAESIPHHVWTVRRDGTAGYCNQRLMDYTGLSSEQLCRGEFPALHPDDVQAAETAWRNAWEQGSDFDLEQRIRAGDGTYRRFVCRGVPLKDRHGRAVECFGTNTDVEERRHAQAALQKLQTKLVQVERATSMGELAAAIAHEVNQPLSAVVLNAEACNRLLKRPDLFLEEIRQSVDDIVESASRAAEVLSRIRARITGGRSSREHLEINEIITEVLEFMRLELTNRRVSLHLELQAELPLVLGDRVELQQVLVNLISNGIDAMDSVWNRPRELWVGSSHSAAEVFVSVRDCGAGLDRDEDTKAFEAFFTTKPNGMGMGLPISRFVVQAHGGRIWASRAEPNGAIFQFALPSVSRETQHA